jgi:hypothetical protein
MSTICHHNFIISLLLSLLLFMSELRLLTLIYLILIVILINTVFSLLEYNNIGVILK